MPIVIKKANTNKWGIVEDGNEASDNSGGSGSGTLKCYAISLATISYPLFVMSYGGTSINSSVNDLSELTTLIDGLEAAGAVTNDGTNLQLLNVAEGSYPDLIIETTRPETLSWSEIPCN